MFSKSREEKQPQALATQVTGEPGLNCSIRIMGAVTWVTKRKQ